MVDFWCRRRWSKRNQIARHLANNRRTMSRDFFYFAYLPRRNCKRCKQRQLTMMIRRNTICMSPLTWRRRAQRWTLECIQRKNVPRQLSLPNVQWQLVDSLGILAPLLCWWKEKIEERIKIKTSRRSFFLEFQISASAEHSRYWRLIKKKRNSFEHMECSLFCGIVTWFPLHQKIKWHQTQFITNGSLTKVQSVFRCHVYMWMCRLIYTIKMLFNKNRTQPRQAHNCFQFIRLLYAQHSQIHFTFSHALCHTPPVHSWH